MFSLELIWIGFNHVNVWLVFLSFFKKLFFLLLFLWCCYWLPIYLPRNWEAMFLYSNHRQFMDILLCKILWCHCLIVSAAFLYILFHPSSWSLDWPWSDHWSLNYCVKHIDYLFGSPPGCLELLNYYMHDCSNILLFLGMWFIPS